MTRRRHASSRALPIAMALMTNLVCAGCDSNGDSAPADQGSNDAGVAESGRGGTGGGSGGNSGAGGTNGGTGGGTAGASGSSGAGGQSGFGTVRLRFRVQ